MTEATRVRNYEFLGLLLDIHKIFVPRDQDNDLGGLG